MNDMLLQVAGVIAATVIFSRAEPALNIMGPGCRPSIRLAFWLLVVGPATLLVSITQGYVPNIGTVAAMSGIAVLLVAERRLRSLLRKKGQTIEDRGNV